jgi:hypothetical protein
MGIDMKSLLAGLVGGRLGAATGGAKEITVNVDPQ